MTGAVEQVGPGCYAWMRLPGGWGETNIGLITGDGASLLVDTPWDRRLTRAMLGAFETHTSRAPVSMVFNTHPDVDHWWGNAELPRAEVVASQASDAHMRTESTPQQMASMQKLGKLLGHAPGKPGLLGRYVTGMLGGLHFDEVTLRFPDRTFTHSRTETIGGRTVEFRDLGQAHTASDSIVVVPESRVVYTGDLLFSKVTPVMWHGPVSGWLAALEKIMGLDADVFVAGHGPVSTRTELQLLHNYWSWLSASVASYKQQGVGIAETAERLVTSPEFAAYCDWPSPERLYINVATIDRQLDGKGPIPTTPVQRGRALTGVACLAHHIRDTH